MTASARIAELSALGWRISAHIADTDSGALRELYSLPPQPAGLFRTVYIPHDTEAPLIFGAYVATNGRICGPDGERIPGEE